MGGAISNSFKNSTSNKDEKSNPFSLFIIVAGILILVVMAVKFLDFRKLQKKIDTVSQKIPLLPTEPTTPEPIGEPLAEPEPIEEKPDKILSKFSDVEE